MVFLYFLGARRRVSLVTKRFSFQKPTTQYTLILGNNCVNQPSTVKYNFNCSFTLILSSNIISFVYFSLVISHMDAVSRQHDTIFCRFSTRRRTLCRSGVFVGQTASRSGLNRVGSPGSECLSLWGWCLWGIPLFSGLDRLDSTGSDGLPVYDWCLWDQLLVSRPGSLIR